MAEISIYDLDDLEEVLARVENASRTLSSGKHAATFSTGIVAGLEHLLESAKSGKDKMLLPELAEEVRNAPSGPTQKTLAKIRTWLVVSKRASASPHSGASNPAMPTERESQAMPQHSNDEEQPQTYGGWVLLDQLGGGGQGQVHAAWNDDRKVRGALKIVIEHADRGKREKARSRFKDEMETLGRTRHPFVARVLDFGDDYYVTRVAEQGSLHGARGAFEGDLWRVVRLGRCLALALAKTHELEIVHRDVKPKNILLESLDHPLLADFGIAHHFDNDARTNTGEQVGPFHYAPPEYEDEAEYDADGERLNLPTPAFDIYCLGATLHWAVTRTRRKKPYRSPFEALVPVAKEVGAVAAPFDELLKAMMDPSPDKRPTAVEVIAGLDRIMGGLLAKPPRTDGCPVCGAERMRELGGLRPLHGTELNLGDSPIQQVVHTVRVCDSCRHLEWRASTNA
jgi:hypothetical protein